MMGIRTKRIIVSLMIGLSLSVAHAQEGGGASDRQAATEGFIQEMVTRHGFSPDELRALFSQVQTRESIISAMDRPAESKPWDQYRPIFVTDSRARAGVDFWNRHADVLSRAAQRFGVPEEVIVAIIGVETRYGQHTGGYRVIDALSTLAFGYPRRASFFRGELEQFLLLSRAEVMDPMQLQGSYAGAMGIPQFMPSSFQRYAIDFDNDGRRDIWNNVSDAVGSVANYLAEHGWQRGQPIAVPARLNGELPASLRNTPTRMAFTVKELRAMGIEPTSDVDDSHEAMLIVLETARGPEVWIGFRNFYAITRYNLSKYYAMAVTQLANQIAARRAQMLEPLPENP